MRLILVLLATALITSCGSKDKKQLIGKWHSEDFWFEFHDDKKYSGGRGPIVSVKEEEYVLETKDKKLTFYTSNQSESYYLIYSFIGEDTLVLTNSMNVTAVPAKYYKK